MRDFTLDNLTDPEGRPIAGAKLDVWQTAASGACKGKP